METLIHNIVAQLQCALLESEDEPVFLPKALVYAEELEKKPTITLIEAEELRKQVQRGVWESSLDLSQETLMHPLSQSLKFADELVSFHSPRVMKLLRWLYSFIDCEQAPQRSGVDDNG